MLVPVRRTMRRQYFPTSLVQSDTGETPEKSCHYGNHSSSKFLSGLGSLVDTTTIDPGRVFMGGLDPGQDGQFAYVWQDDAMQVKQNYGTQICNAVSSFRWCSTLPP